MNQAKATIMKLKTAKTNIIGITYTKKNIVLQKQLLITAILYDFINKPKGIKGIEIKFKGGGRKVK